MTVRFGLTLSFVLGIGMFGFRTGALADAPQFSDATIEGTFATLTTGVVATSIEVASGEPLVAVGTITFNQDGSCTTAATINAGGFVIPPADPPTPCEFSVNADGTGVITIFGSSPFAPVELAIVIVNEDKLFVIGSDEIIQSGVFERQDDDDDDEDDDEDDDD